MQFPRYWSHCELLLKAVNRHGVEYLIIGSMAKSYYHPVQGVGDMDVLINPTAENLRKVRTALAEVGITLKSPIEASAQPFRQIPCSHYHETYADILTPNPRFGFCDAFSRSIEIQVYGDIRARIASEHDLNALDALREQENRDDRQSDPEGALI